MHSAITVAPESSWIVCKITADQDSVQDHSISIAMLDVSTLEYQMNHRGLNKVVEIIGGMAKD